MGLLNKFRQQANKMEEHAEVLEHLCDLLNTKKNFGTYPLDYGVDTYVYRGSNKKIVNQIMADIRYCLEKYEKRIQVMEIQTVASPNRFLLSFLIKCKIEKVPHAFHLSFHHQKNWFNIEGKNEF